MNREQTTGLGSTNFYRHIQVDQVNSHANFHSNCQHSWLSFSISKFIRDRLANRRRMRQTHLECEYLVNGDRYGKHCYCQQIESRIRPFHWHIYTWPWLILKVKVKVKVHISTVNTSQTVTDRADIPIVSKYEVAYGLSINVFRFNLGTF